MDWFNQNTKWNEWRKYELVRNSNDKQKVWI